MSRVIGGPIRHKDYKADFLKSIETPVIVSKDDPADVQEVKRAVIEARLLIKEAIDRGEDPADVIKEAYEEAQKLAVYKDDIRREVLNMAEAWDAYLHSPFRRDLSENTVRGKEQVFRQFVEWMSKVYPEVVEVRHTQRMHTEKYLDHLRREHAASTYNNRLCVLREVYRNIMAKALLKENPWDGFPLRADDSHSRRELTIEELARLVNAERNAARREEKYANVVRANADAAKVGTWGAKAPANALPSINRKNRAAWLSGCIRKWCNRNSRSLLDGTTRLIANGGYAFLQEIWNKGVEMTTDDALEALGVFLMTKEGK